MNSADLQLRSVQVRYPHSDGQEERCSLEDAAGVAFETCGAIRHIPHRADQAHTPSTHWSSTTNRMIDCESYPSHSTSVHPETKLLMFDLEGDLRAESRHGLFGHVLAELVEQFLDRLEREDPLPQRVTAE